MVSGQALRRFRYRQMRSNLLSVVKTRFFLLVITVRRAFGYSSHFLVRVLLAPRKDLMLV